MGVIDDLQTGWAENIRNLKSINSCYRRRSEVICTLARTASCIGVAEEDIVEARLDKGQRLPRSIGVVQSRYRIEHLEGNV